MKIVTNDYGCGTSSSILDYEIEDVVVVSPKNYEHVYDIDDDLFFVGHDFLFYLWDTAEKVDKLKSNSNRKIVWCFERVDAIVPVWKKKSLYSIAMIQKFADQIYVCDEDDVGVYGDWFPQWASPVFFENRSQVSLKNKILFSGQAGKPEYHMRNQLLNSIFSDHDLSAFFEISNSSRSLNWEQYCQNLLLHKCILNPVGVLRGFNTRSYEVMYSGRLLLQHTIGDYKNHNQLIGDCKSILTFSTFDELKHKITNMNIEGIDIIDSSEFYEKNNIFARFKKIGVDIK